MNLFYIRPLIFGEGGLMANQELRVLKEFWAFMKVRKKWWLAPIVFTLLGLGALLMMAQGSAVAPFIYTLF